MRLSASISPPSRLFTCRRNEFLAGLKPAVGAVPAVAMYLRVQTIVNVRQSEVPLRTHPLFARGFFAVDGVGVVDDGNFFI